MDSFARKSRRFIERLNEIDLADLFNKAKGFKLEDLKDYRFPSIQSLKESAYLPYCIGYGSALVLASALLPLSWNHLSQVSSLAQQYQREASDLPSLRSQVKRDQNRIRLINEQLPKLTSLVPEPSQLIFLPELFSQASLKTNTLVNSFTPIAEQEARKCAAAPSSDAVASQQTADNQPTSSPGVADGADTTSGDQPATADPNAVSQPAQTSPAAIRPPFKSNFFQLQLQADYLNIMAFLRSIQDYSIVIIPSCLEVGGLAAEQADATNQLPYATGQVTSRLVVDVPTLSSSAAATDSPSSLPEP